MVDGEEYQRALHGGRGSWYTEGSRVEVVPVIHLPLALLSGVDRERVRRTHVRVCMRPREFRYRWVYTCSHVREYASDEGRKIVGHHQWIQWIPDFSGR